jgi:hypothetical protein
MLPRPLFLFFTESAASERKRSRKCLKVLAEVAESVGVSGVLRLSGAWIA